MNDLEIKINYIFHDRDLLTKALTHSSTNPDSNYERLEFIGDSIISFFISDWLYNTFKDDNEGTLSIKRAQLINKTYLSKISKRLELYKYFDIQENTPISSRIHTDIFESITGAIYLDSNYNTVSDFLNGTLIKEFIKFNKLIDYKGEIISYSQKNIIDKIDINTSLLDNTDTFISSININDEQYFYGFGRNKTKAEQRASKIALYQTKEIYKK